MKRIILLLCFVTILSYGQTPPSTAKQATVIPFVDQTTQRIWNRYVIAGLNPFYMEMATNKALQDSLSARLRFTSAEKTKLAGIATGATANQTDAYLLARPNHTGTEPISVVSGLQAALDAKEPTITILPVSKGGTGKATVTSGALQKGNGTSALVDAVAGTDYVVPSALTGYVKLSPVSAQTGNINISGTGTANDFQTTGANGFVATNGSAGQFNNVGVSIYGDGSGGYTALKRVGFEYQSTGSSFKQYLNFSPATSANKTLIFPDENGTLATREYVSGLYTPLVRTLNINGTTFDLSANRTFNITDITGNSGTATKLATARNIAITGDGAGAVSFDGSAGITIPLTIASVNFSPGNFGSATAVPALTVNAKGQVTTVTNTPIQIAESQVTNLTSDLASKLSSETDPLSIHIGSDYQEAIGYKRFKGGIGADRTIFMGSAANDNPSIGDIIQMSNTNDAATTTAGYAIQLGTGSDLLFNSFSGAPGSISFIPRFRMTNGGLLNYSNDMGTSYGDRTVTDFGNVKKYVHSETGYTVTLTGSGNGSNTTITIPHGLTGIDTDSFVLLTPNSNAASNYKYATVDATNVYIYYAVAPTSGSQNLSYSALIKYVQR